VTRLTEGDVRGLVADLVVWERGLQRLTGLGLAGLAERACEADAGAATQLRGARIGVVPISAGLGFIPGFSQCVAAILGHLGGDAFVTPRPDVLGWQYAAEHGAELVFAADDYRFIALNIRTGMCVDNDPATAAGYVAALDVAVSVAGAPVLVIGLGPVGRAAARRLDSLGAQVLAAEIDRERAQAAEQQLNVRLVSLGEGLAACALVVDAAPAADLIPVDWVGARSVVVAPGLPPAATAATRAALGDRHVHDPLAVGVAVMALAAISGQVPFAAH
jgi:pyrrolysine biosynthesis protein PylD